MLVYSRIFLLIISTYNPTPLKIHISSFINLILFGYVNWGFQQFFSFSFYFLLIITTKYTFVYSRKLSLSDQSLSQPWEKCLWISHIWDFGIFFVVLCSIDYRIKDAATLITIQSYFMNQSQNNNLISLFAKYLFSPPPLGEIIW